MVDLTQAANLAQVAHTVMQAAPGATHIAPSVNPIETGVSYMTEIITAVAAFVVGGGLGMFYGNTVKTALKADLALARIELNKVTSAVHLPPV
jgi:hypothetical protein